MKIKLMILLLIIAFFLPVYAAENTYGYLRCIIKSENGAFCANEKVIVTSSGKIFNYTTDAKGFFTTMVQSGDITISVAGYTKTVKIIEGETTDIELNIVKPGIFLTMNNALNDVEYTSTISFMQGKKRNIISYCDIVNGKYFANVPDDITSFSIKVSAKKQGKSIFPDGYYHKVWNFDTKDSRRNLTFNFPEPATISLKLYNSDGSVVADGTKIIGKFNRNIPSDEYFGDWMNVDLKDDSRPLSNDEYHNYLLFEDTVLNGMITVPTCMPAISYTIQMSIAGGIRGSAVPFIIDENGKSSMSSYRFASRKITQTIFDNFGKPALNREVNASYILDGELHLISSKTNEKGIVIWDNIPDRRATVWGENIPAVVLPIEEDNVNYMLKFPENYKSTIRISSSEGMTSGHFSYINNYSKLISGPINLPSIADTCNIECSNNSILSIYLMTNSDIPKYKIMNFYVPYDDFPNWKQNIRLPELKIAEYKIVNKEHVKVLNADKLTPALINCVAVSADNFISEDSGFISSLIKTKITDDGFDLWYANQGKYRVNIDILDNTNNPLAVLTLPMKNDAVIVMPVPSGNVPGGSVVSWIGTNNPTETHYLRYLTTNKDMPVYANSENIIAWWCKTSSKNIRVWKNGQITNLSLRTFNIRQVDEKGFPVTRKDFFNNNQISMLFPPLKQTRDLTEMTLSYEITDGSEYSDIKISNAGTVNLWTTKYLLNERNEYMAPSILNITKDTPENMDIIKTNKKSNQTSQPIQFELIVDSPVKYGMGYDYKIVYDGDENNPFIFNHNKYTPLIIPANAKTMTITYPDIGILKDKPVEVKNNLLSVRTHDFQPLKVLKGQVTDTDGNIITATTVMISRIDLSDVNCMIRGSTETDENGKYVFKNLPSGLYQLICEYSKRNMSKCMIVKVEENSSETVADLKVMVNNPDCRYLETNVGLYSQLYGNIYGWYISDAKDSISQLPTCSFSLFMPDSQVGKGYYYYLSTDSKKEGIAAFSDTLWSYRKGNSKCYKPTANFYIVSNIPMNLKYPPLIYISGTGIWESVKYRQQLKWITYSGINTAVTKISGFPPGKWKIKIIADKVIEKEILMTNINQTVRVEL